MKEILVKGLGFRVQRQCVSFRFQVMKTLTLTKLATADNKKGSFALTYHKRVGENR